MAAESPRVFRIFVASPGDVVPEREIVFRVIDELNELWGNSDPPARLELLSWEGVPPSPGKSQEVINHWNPVESSDVFIVILWKRFGMPPQMNRPQDNKPYLSGTQLEIETAYESWKTKGRPHFMLYWKEDNISIDLSDDDVEQFKIVKSYMRKFEAGGEYPALYKRFRKNKFRQILKRNLARVISSLVKTSTEGTIVKTDRSSDPVPDTANDKGPQLGPMVDGLTEDIEQIKWLNQVQLKNNPFRYQRAEHDKSLSLYFTRFPGLHTVNIDDLTQERKSWFFFGKDGSGKTALRKFIAARGRPKRADSDMVCIEYDQVEFENLLNNTNDISEFPLRFVQAIFEAVSPYTGNAIKSSQPPGNLRGNLAALSSALRDVGIDWMLCLIDPGLATFDWKGSQASTASLISSLFFAFSEVGGYGFRYFLPASMKDELKPTFKRLPFNYIREMDIQWDERALRDMLGKRMTQLSVDQLAPYRSLGELCEDEQNLSTLIDSEIAGFAQGNPRAAVWLANRLIEQHCYKDPPPRITAETWEQVKQAWREQGESRILGTSGSSGFRVLSERIYYQNKEIILPERSDRLLKAIILTKGGFSSKQELKKAGWIDEKNLEGISEKALSEAMRRMKEELKTELKAKGFLNFDGIKSVRGRGYRLLQPGTNQPVQEGIHD